MKKIILLTLLCLPTILFCQKIQIQQFEFIEGKWTGELQYLDYGDNKTLVNLATDLECQRAGRKMKYSYIYTEPNGKRIKEKGKIKVKRNGQVSFGGDLYEVSKNKKDDIMMSKEGKDNGGAALISRQLILKDGALLITKVVTKNNDAFLRNKYTFQKQ